MPDIHRPRPIGPSFAHLQTRGGPMASAATAWVDHAARAADSTEPADWIGDRLLPTKGSVPVGAIVPTGFEAYVRVLHPARGGAHGGTAITWHEVAGWTGRTMHPEVQWEAVSRSSDSEAGVLWDYDPELGQCPAPVRRALVARLRDFTPSDWCWAAVWEGWGYLPSYPEVPKVRLPGRDYLLFACPWTLLESSIFRGEAEDHAAPSLWWPPDRAWIVATEVDFRWTYVGGARACIETLLADERLETLPSDVLHRADYLSDVINGPVPP